MYLLLLGLVTVYGLFLSIAKVPLLLEQYLKAVNKKDVETITLILQEGVIRVDEVLKVSGSWFPAHFIDDH